MDHRYDGTLKAWTYIVATLLYDSAMQGHSRKRREVVLYEVGLRRDRPCAAGS